jgi:hypothetical protein
MPSIGIAYQPAQRPAVKHNGRPEAAVAAPKAGPQVPLLTVMVGNLAEKSLALAATFTATWRATAL